MEPARTVPAGHFQVTSSTEIAAPIGDLRDIVDEARANRRARTLDGVTQLAEDGGALLVQAPVPAYRLALAYGLSRRVAFSVHTSVLGIGGGVRWQFLRVAPGIYGALSFSVTGYVKGTPADRLVKGLRLNDFGRRDFALGALFGYGSRNFHFWSGPKAIWSRVDAKLSFCMDNVDDGCAGEATAVIDAKAAYYGGQVGVAFGHYRWWIAFELTVARLLGDGNGSVAFAGETRTVSPELGATVINPAVGLILWI